MTTFPHPLRAALLAVAVLLAAAAPAAAAVSVYPSPGTPSASRVTQISFRGIAPGQLGNVVVQGSRSGAASGSLQEHSDGQGASWIPARPFRRRETVTVNTDLDVTGGTNGDFSFTIGRFVRRVRIPHGVLPGEAIPPGRTLRFRSRPDLNPPRVTVSAGAQATAPGLIFLTPKSKLDLRQAGPEIVDNNGQPIWFRPLPGIQAATDFRAQTYRGEPVLTWWQGTSRQGIGTGQIIVMDQSYKIIRRITTPNGFRPDLHEFLITPQSTGLLITYPSVYADLRGFGGTTRSQVVDSVVQEVDLENGAVLFEWHSLGHIDFSEAFNRPMQGPRVPWDYVHANSVGLDSDGNILMSGRTTWAAYKIDRATGAIIWRLGGKRSDFQIGRGAHFAWQHDVRRRADGAITLFDNSNFPAVRKHSRAIAIQLDETAKTATLLSSHTHPRGLLVATQGNQQALPGGNSLVGWGSQRWVTEFDAAGNVVWNARVALGFETYRAYRVPWVGRPATDPRVAGIGLRRGGMNVYATWNGATEVATWDILGGASEDALELLGSTPRTGFETGVFVQNRTAFVAVRAKDADGNVLGTSPARRVRR